jgi:VWFA-related protein
MNTSSLLWKSIFFAAILLGLVPLLPGSADTGQDNLLIQKSIQHESTVILKLVQVYVTGRSGKPVTDLEIADFVLHDNGTEKKISDFERHILPIKRRESDQVESQEPADRAIQSDRMSRKFFFLFDYAFNSVKGIQKAKETALSFMDDKVLPSDQISLISYSVIRNLKIHEYLTNDHAKIRESIQNAEQGHLSGRAIDIEEQYWKNREVSYLEGEVEDQEAATWKSPTQDGQDRLASKNQALNYIIALTNLAKALRYVPGQKNMVLFSSGIPSSMLYGTGQPYAKNQLDFGDHELQKKSEEMIRELTSANCSVFTFNTIGKDTDLFRDDKKSFEERNRSILATPRQDSVSFGNVVSQGERTLGHISNATGGKHFGHIDNYDNHLEKLQNITGSYYVLGYSISEQDDGKYHNIKVEVTRPGCRVFAQKGYFNPKPFSEYSKLEKMIHLVDLALSDNPFQRPLSFPMLALPNSQDKKDNLLLLSFISGQSIQELTGEKVEIVHLVFDNEDNIVDLTRRERAFKSGDFENLFDWKFLSLDPGDYKCRVVIRNLDTGLGAVASSDVVVFKAREGSIQLFPPMIAIPWRGDSGESALSSVLARVYPLAGNQVPLCGPLKRDTTNFSLILRCALGGIADPELRLRFGLRNLKTGKSHPITYDLSRLLEGEDLRIFVLELETEPLLPGDYILHCFADEVNTRSISQSYTTLTIR